MRENCYAQEAAIKCRDYYFEHELSDNVISMMHVNNIASEIVAIKNGMTLEKLVDGFKVFSITREEWLDLKENGL